MSAPRSFDRLAGIYQALEYLAFGRDLERARYAHLDRLRECRSILVAGEGDGRCLAQLVRAAPRAKITCLDSSPEMIAKARARLAGTTEADRVTFRVADLLATELPAGGFDAAVTLFFLDCFTPAQAEQAMSRISRALDPGAWWLWADFAVPGAGFRRLRARAWLAVLYTFFRWQTRLPARELPPVERIFATLGFAPQRAASWQAGMVRSVAWRSAAASLPVAPSSRKEAGEAGPGR